jgi:phospholipid/cholesterol/gamma-HCH transport system substrate-binding protein
METRANYVLIGVFTLAIVAGVFGFVYWFQNIGGTGERAYYRIVFDGSVSGLRTGASVLFNGIRVGEVTGLKLDPAKPQQVAATLSIDKSVTVRDDTQIGLEFQGLTGIAAVSLKGGRPDAKVVVGVGPKEVPPALVAPPGATQDVTQAARDTLRRLDDFIAANQDAFRSALANIDKVTATLARNSEHFDNVMANIDKFTGALGRNSKSIDNIVAGLQNLTGGEDGKGGEINEAARSLKHLSDNLDKRTAEITTGVNSLTSVGTRQLDSLSSDAKRTLQSIDRAVRNLDRNPSRLIFGGSGSALPEYKGR